MWISGRIISRSAVSELLAEVYKQGIMHRDPLIASLLLSTFVFIIPNLCRTCIYTLFSFVYLARKALLLLFSMGLKCEPLSPQN